MKTLLIMASAVLPLAFMACNQKVLNDISAGQESLSYGISMADPVITTGMTLSQINATIMSADSGQTVWVEPGTYTITGKIQMKAGVTVQRKVAVDPIFDATGTPDGMLVMAYYGNQMNHCMFRGIAFRNIRFAVYDAVNPKFFYCTFDYGKRVPGTDETYYQDAYVHLTNTDSALVDNCTFYRRAGNSGRAIWNTKASNTRIINNDIGDGGSLGYFVTAINETETHNTVIQANHILRTTALSDPLQTDHGIYAHSFDGVLIKYNTISGWPATADGGAVKARNGQNLDIFGNTMNGSGILLYEYATPVTHPFLKNVIVSYNTINIVTNANDMYHGIGYWRNNAAGTEYSIRFSTNTLPNGTIYVMGSHLSIAGFNAVGGGVFNNDTGILSLKPGINQSGNY